MKKVLLFLALIILVIFLISFSHSSKKKTMTEKNISLGPPRGELLVNTRLFEFDSRMLDPWIERITHLRAFGVDFKKPKDSTGQYQYIDDAKMDDVIAFTKEHDLKVVWTLNVSSSTLEQEMVYVKNIIARGLPIVAFEYGGEFYLKKYYEGDLSAKGVVEKIRMDGEHRDYLDLLDLWLPRFTNEFPFDKYEHILVTASVGDEDNKVSKYRKEFNKKVFDYVRNNPALTGRVDFSYHLYAGSKPYTYSKDEERVYPADVDWSFLKEKPADSRWVVTESGYYVNNFSKNQLDQAQKFYEDEARALGPNDLMGIHTLFVPTTRKNPLALYTAKGISPVGLMLQNWLQKTR